MPIELCDVAYCKEPATHTYVWAWGESGFVCPVHQMVHAQTARQIKRHIQFTALTPGAPERVTFDERIGMHAEVLASREEVAAVKERNATIYAANQQLIAEVRREHAHAAELESQIADVRAELDQVTSEKMAALRQVAELTDELVRAKNVWAADAALG